MIHTEIPEGLGKRERGLLIAVRLQGIVASERDPLANLCNSMAFLYWTLGGVNWVGLYILREGDLVLGPFAGKPACSRIALGKGVCGTAAATGQTQLVPDVEQFPGHIACDDASRSELVLPIFAGEKLWGVLDLDSPELNRFDEEDVQNLSAVAGLLEPIIREWERSRKD